MTNQATIATGTYDPFTNGGDKFLRHLGGSFISLISLGRSSFVSTFDSPGVDGHWVQQRVGARNRGPTHA